MENDKVRIDKWLWAVRICKTRKLAAELCSRGRVKVAASPVKPSRTVSKGDIVTLRKEGMDWRYEVLECIEKRVGAKLVPEKMKDLTPKEEVGRYKSIKASNSRILKRPKGAGRPTKRDRRRIDRLKG